VSNKSHIVVSVMSCTHDARWDADMGCCVAGSHSLATSSWLCHCHSGCSRRRECCESAQ